MTGFDIGGCTNHIHDNISGQKPSNQHQEGAAPVNLPHQNPTRQSVGIITYLELNRIGICS